MSAGLASVTADTLDIDDLSGGVRLTDSSTLTFNRESGSRTDDMKFAWEVWEYTGASGGDFEFIVRGTYQITLTGETATQSVSGISDIDDCIPFITGISSNSGSDDADSGTAIAWMSSGTLNIKRGSASNNTVIVNVAVVEFTGQYWNVKHGRQEGSGTDSGTITLVDAADGTTSGGGDVSDWGHAFIIHQYKANALNGVDDSISDTSPVIVPGSNTTSVDWLFHSDHVDSASAGSREEFFVHVLCSDYINVSRFSNTASHAGAKTITISSLDLSDTTMMSVDVTRSTSGAGVAYGRGWVNIRIVDASTIELWVHRNGNTINTNFQVVDFSALKSISIRDQGDEQLDYNDSNELLDGRGFGATQGSGFLELASSSDYSSATKVTQTIVSWDNYQITFTPVFTGLDEGSVWLFVTNDSSERTEGYKVNFGEIGNDGYILSLHPDLYHRFNNSYTDEIGVADANSNNTRGTVGFHATPISRGVTHSWSVADNDSRVEVNDTNFTNLLTTKKRTIGGWIQLDRVHLTPSGIYEEGGGVNNLYMVVGFGNKILANQADSNGNPDYKIQGYSDEKLSINRPYHIMLRFACSSTVGADDGRFTFFVDGKKVSKYAGFETIPNLIKDTTFSPHSGDWSYGKPDGNLDTGGTDVNYPGATNTLLNDWATWSDTGNSSGYLTDQEIRNIFVLGAIPSDTISSDSVSNMQTAVSNLSGNNYGNVPLAIKIKKPKGEDDLEVTFDDITFDNKCSCQVVWIGSGTLTITTKNGTNLDSSLCEAPMGGTIDIIPPKVISIEGQVDGSTIIVLDSTDKSELGRITNSTSKEAIDVYSSKIDVIVIADKKVIVQLFDIVISGDTLVQIVQENDYAYDNPV
jgi:hypothetical protein